MFIFFCAVLIQEAATQQTPQQREPDLQAEQRVDFDLPLLATRLKRRQEAAAADLEATQQRAKRARFAAASLQVGLLTAPFRWADVFSAEFVHQGFLYSRIKNQKLSIGGVKTCPCLGTKAVVVICMVIGLFLSRDVQKPMYVARAWCPGQAFASKRAAAVKCECQLVIQSLCCVQA